MAQNYEIDIKRFNGQDYDTLLPTPAAHASTHQADGSDPITLQAGNYGDSSIPTSAYQDASVSRAKLAQDALYSPFKGFDSSGVLTISNNDIGKTIRPINGNVDYTINIARDTSIPTGAEVAIFRQQAKTINIVFGDNVRVAIPGETSYMRSPTLTIEPFGMIALKKITSDSTNDYWLVTGNVEVVS